MAITTLDGMIAGAQPVRMFAKAVVAAAISQTTWGQAGAPGAGTWNSTLNGGTYTSPVNGQMPHTDPGGGNNAYLSRAFFGHLTGGTTTGYAMLCDRLWDNGGIDVTSTTAQNITSPTWPSRDAAGGTTGIGVLLALDVSVTVVGAATPTFTVSYTNSAGTSGRSTTNVSGSVAAPVAGRVFYFGLQAGDVGIRSVQSITLSNAWTSGTINLVAFRPLTVIALGGNQGNVDCITGGFPRLYNGSVPFWIYQLGTAPGNPIYGIYAESQG
jgi:hypothetical protein